MDGIAGIIPHSAFEIPTNSLPSNYLTKKGESKIAFILHTIDHNFNNNKWTTKITGQTLNIRFDEIEDTKEKTTNIIFPNPTTPPFIDTTPINLQGPISPSQEFWTLVAICSREDNNPQGWADIAQSLYNRLGSKAYQGKNLTTLITNRSQYEPTWKYPNGPKRGVGSPNKEWFEIQDINSASAATKQPINKLQEVAKTLKNLTFQQNSSSFIGGRTDFFGVGQPAKAMTKNGSKKQRTPTSNQFGFSFNYNSPVVFQVPDYIKNFSIT
jgi:hypothetical protein